GRRNVRNRAEGDRTAPPEPARARPKLVATHAWNAAEFRDPASVMRLLRGGLPVDARDKHDWTPLMIAAFNGKEAVAKVLIEQGADPQARDRRGYTPLHWAALSGHAALVRLLLENGADRDARTGSGSTALMQAESKGHD